jgi:hypothetical protein
MKKHLYSLRLQSFEHILRIEFNLLVTDSPASCPFLAGVARPMHMIKSGEDLSTAQFLEYGWLYCASTASE